MPGEDRVDKSVEDAVQDMRKLLDGLVGTDPLTGLGNSRAFSMRLETDSGATPLGLVTAEVNGFKGINSDHGHQQADLLLVEIAVRIRDAIQERPGAQAFRLGGDEFAIVLPEDDHAAVAAVGRAVRDCIAAQRFTLPGDRETLLGEVTVAVVVGCVGRGRPPEQRRRLRDELDALTEYQKHMGMTEQVVCLWEMERNPDYLAFAQSGRAAERHRLHCPDCRSRGYVSLTPPAKQCPRCSAYFEAQLA